jgi:TatD DNase family protein
LDEVPDLPSVLERAGEAGVAAIVAVGVDYESNSRVLEIAESHPSQVFAGLGSHPGNLPETASEIERNLQFIEDNIARAVVIGEIGLDYHKRVVGHANKDQQKSTLKDVLSLAKRWNKPVSVHSRYAWRDTFGLVRESGVQKVVFHWYTGPTNVLRDIVEAGGFSSATLAAEYHAEHRRAIREVPLERLMLETDCPVFYRSLPDPRPSEPADVARVLQAVALLREMDPSALAHRTTQTALTFFALGDGVEKAMS